VSKYLLLTNLDKANRKSKERIEVFNKTPMINLETPNPALQDVLSVLRIIDSGKISVSDKGNARLIKVSDPVVALTLVNDSRLKDLCIPAEGGYIAIPSSNENAFR